MMTPALATVVETEMARGQIVGTEGAAVAMAEAWEGNAQRNNE